MAYMITDIVQHIQPYITYIVIFSLYILTYINIPAIKQRIYYLSMGENNETDISKIQKTDDAKISKEKQV